MSEPKPKVSVLMITYNHEKYIEQAVRSVMMQETDFEYELVIGEDCSTDRTREIVLALQKEFPDKIRLILHPQNVGMIPNFVSVYDACRGEYIALCEGDDYWTSPHKLQTQVDYMEAHPECRICFHAAQVVFEDEPGSPAEVTNTPPLDLSIKQLITREYLLPTASVIFKSPYKPLPQWYFELVASGDWALYVWLLLSGGTVNYLETPQPMSVYRKHSKGATVSDRKPGSKERKDVLLNRLHDIYLVKSSLPTVYIPIFRLRLFKIYREIMQEYLCNDDLIKATYHFLCMLFNFPRLTYSNIIIVYVSLINLIKNSFKAIKRTRLGQRDKHNCRITELTK